MIGQHVSKRDYSYLLVIAWLILTKNRVAKLRYMLVSFWRGRFSVFAIRLIRSDAKLRKSCRTDLEKSQHECLGLATETYLENILIHFEKIMQHENTCLTSSDCI